MLNKTEHILQNNKCDKCTLTIHPDFIGYHKCGYANCPICKIQSQIRNTGSTSDHIQNMQMIAHSNKRDDL